MTNTWQVACLCVLVTETVTLVDRLLAWRESVSTHLTTQHGFPIQEHIQLRILAQTPYFFDLLCNCCTTSCPQQARPTRRLACCETMNTSKYCAWNTRLDCVVIPSVMAASRVGRNYGHSLFFAVWGLKYTWLCQNFYGDNIVCDAIFRLTTSFALRIDLRRISHKIAKLKVFGL